MKRLLLLFVGLSIGLFAVAQQNHRPVDNSRASEPVAVKLDLDRKILDPKITQTEFSMPENLMQRYATQRFDNIEKEHIITTDYDLQTNSNLSSRVIAWPDGSVAATVTMGFDPVSGNRGTGYNYYDGASWGAIPEQRIEPHYAGWPSITPYGENGEAFVSHNLIDNLWNVVMYVREEKGVGDWEMHYTFPNPEGYEMTWPRIVSSGENNQYLHVIAGDQLESLETYLFYNRSTDGGETWEGWISVPHVDEEVYDHRITPDDIVFASNGDNVAFGIATVSFFDVFYVKSEDNGETWQKNTIFENPLWQYWDDFENETFDSTYVPDNSLAIAMDFNGDVHAVFGITRIIKPAVGTGYEWWPFTNGIVYWNESIGAFPEHPNGELYTLEPEHLFEHGMLAGWTPDLNGDGSIGEGVFEETFYYRSTSGLATMPTIAIDEIGSILIAFSTIDELRQNDIFFYRSIFTSYKDGVYGTWYYVQDHLMEDFIHFFDEGIYPTAAAKAYNNTFHLIFQADVTQGTAWGPETQPGHDPQENYIHAVKIGGYWVGLSEKVNPINHITSAYPNPVSGEAFYIDISLKQRVSKGQINISNMAGQLVYSKDMNKLNVGLNKVQLDVTNLQSGVYFYTVTVDDYKETKKVMIVR